MKPENRMIADWVGAKSSVLDLGCGDGELLSMLVEEKDIRAQGIEIDEQAILKCVARGLSVFHEDLDTGLSDYPDGSFDYVIMSGSLQQVKKPDFVMKEAFRVGRRLIVSFPNFAYWRARLQIFFGGRVPVTSSLPYEWYDTPNLHFLSISNFVEYCRIRGISIEGSRFIGRRGAVKLLPNLRALEGVFLLSRPDGLR